MASAWPDLRHSLLRTFTASGLQKEAAEAYETRLNKILKESTLAYQQTRRAQQQQPVSGAGLQQKASASAASAAQPVAAGRVWRGPSQLSLPMLLHFCEPRPMPLQ